MSHAYLLHAFASHLLKPERSLLEANAKIVVPPISSHWSILFSSSMDTAEASAMTELAACVRGLLSLDMATEDAGNRQKLGVFKFLGLAVSSAGTVTDAAQVRELCELGIQKKF